MALVSHKHKFIFIHIFKCAGMSMREAMSGIELEEVGGGHAIAKDLKKMIPYYDEYNTFCFIRNPFDWMVSIYLYHKRHHQDDWACVENMSFNEFVRYYINEIMTQPRPEGSNKSTTLTEFTTDNGEFIVKNIGRFENLETDWKRISETIGIPFVPLPKINAAVDRFHYRQYYDEETKNLVYERFKEDFEIFDYAW